MPADTNTDLLQTVAVIVASSAFSSSHPLYIILVVRHMKDDVVQTSSCDPTSLP